MAKIPSTHDGVIKSIHFKNDEICPVGKALIEIEVEDGAETAAPAKESSKKEEDTSSSSSDEGQKVGRTPLPASVEASNSKALATPAVRSIAKRHGIDLSKVKATGKDGRVLKEDILAFIDGKQQPTAPVKATSSPCSQG